MILTTVNNSFWDSLPLRQEIQLKSVSVKTEDNYELVIHIKMPEKKKKACVFVLLIIERGGLLTFLL